MNWKPERWGGVGVLDNMSKVYVTNLNVSLINFIVSKTIWRFSSNVRIWLPYNSSLTLFSSAIEGWGSSILETELIRVNLCWVKRGQWNKKCLESSDDMWQSQMTSGVSAKLCAFSYHISSNLNQLSIWINILDL